MVNTVDARGLPCPRPVILTRKAMQEHAALVTIVDSETSQRNVTRMAEKAGYTVRAVHQDDGIYLHIDKGAVPATEVTPQASSPQAGPLVLVIPSEFMGRGEHDELGEILIRGFFHSLGEVRPLPDRVLFFNSGVKLVVEGSAVLEDLDALQQQGVEILACGTCLGYYDSKDRIAVGEVSNMYAIAEAMLQAGKVVTL